MKMRHRLHQHEVVISNESDEIEEVDGEDVEGGYVTRAYSGELILCLPDEVCGYD